MPESPTDLAGEKADAIGFCASRERRVENADPRVAKIGPVSLAFETEHPGAGLPAIAELATSEPSRPLAASVRKDAEIHTIAALAPAAVSADVEAAPVVNGSHIRGP